MKIFKKYLAIPIVFTIIVLGGLAIYVKQQNETKQASAWNEFLNGAKFASTTEVIEKIEDGIYVNSAYGFQFEYPHEIFDISQVGLYAKEGNFYRDFYISSQSQNSAISDHLGVRVNKDEDSVKYFEEIQDLPLSSQKISESSYKQKPKHEWPIGNSMKIRDIKLDGYDGVLIYHYPTGGGEGESSWGYDVKWKVNDKIYSISLYTISGKEALENYRPIFDNIISSFKIIASNN